MSWFRLHITTIGLAFLIIFLTPTFSTAEIIKGKFSRYNKSRKELTLSVVGKGWHVEDKYGFVCSYKIDEVKKEPWFKFNIVIEAEVENVKVIHKVGCKRKCRFVSWAGKTAKEVEPEKRVQEEPQRKVVTPSSNTVPKEPEVGDILRVSGLFEKLNYETIKLRAHDEKDRLHNYYIFEFRVTDKNVLSFLKELEEKDTEMPKVGAKIRVEETIGSVIRGKFIEWTDPNFISSVRQYASKSRKSIEALEDSRIKKYKEENLKTIVGQVENYYERKNYFGLFYGQYGAELLYIIDVPKLYAPKIREAGKKESPVKLKVKFLPKEKYGTPKAILVQWIDANWSTELEQSTDSGVPPKASVLRQLANNASIKIPPKFLLNGIVSKTDVYDAMKIRTENSGSYLIHGAPNDGQKPGDNVSLYIKWERSGYKFIFWNDRTKQMLATSRIKEKRQREEYIADLKKGKIPITTINDAVIYTNALQDTRYTASPPLNGPSDKKQYYIWQGLLTNKFREIYISWDPEFERGFAFTKARKMLGQELCQGAPVVVVGRYVRNYQITLVIGTKKLIPLLEDCYVFGLR
ncbi:MAG: hypothetical protein U9N82_11425 [Thermodesulfobacteriota bacterium]|nr:hypothetical protein [Thermodesulfobacteriota bacterium]